MRYIMAALLIAGAAWAYTETVVVTDDCYWCGGPCQGHEITPAHGAIYNLVMEWQAAEQVRPTPAEMREEGE